jgi:NAD+ kinase
MANPFRHAALVGKFNADGIREELETVARFLTRHGLAVTLEEETAANTGITGYPRLDASALGAACDLAVVVGGDGTMLGIARQLARHDTPLVGINQGRLGFITDVALGDFEGALASILAGAYDEEKRTMLEGGVERDGKTIFDGLALNDVIVSRGASAGMVELRIEIDGEFVAQLRADGLIVGSPTGSTAYALSANGPILHPSLAGLVLVPVAPHTLSNRPIALPDNVEIEIELTEVRDASAFFDMQSFSKLEPGDIVRVRRSTRVATLLHPAGYNYFATLRQKLHWNVMSSDEHGRA